MQQKCPSQPFHTQKHLWSIPVHLDTGRCNHWVMQRPSCHRRKTLVRLHGYLHVSWCVFHPVFCSNLAGWKIYPLLMVSVSTTWLVNLPTHFSWYLPRSWLLVGKWGMAVIVPCFCRKKTLTEKNTGRKNGLTFFGYLSLNDRGRLG